VNLVTPMANQSSSPWAHELLYHGVDTFAYLFAQLFSVT
jgi:hypothetical protein